MGSILTIRKAIESSYACERSGDISNAFQQAQSALAQARDAGDPEVLASALSCMAYMHDRLGHHEQARRLAEEALLQTGPLSDARARAWKTLGDCAHEQGDLATAERYYHDAIDLARQVGLTYMLHRCLHSLATNVYIPRGQFELALAADKESIGLAEQSGFLEEIWLPLLTSSWTLWTVGRVQDAMDVALHMEQHVTPNSLAEGYYCSLRGDLAQEGDNPEAALAWYNRARRLAELLGDPGLSAELRVGIARYHRCYGSSSAAVQWADDAFHVACQSESSDLQGMSLLERGQASWNNGDPDGARRDLEAAIALFAVFPADYCLAQAYLLLAGLLYQQRLPGAAEAWAEAMTRVVTGGYDHLYERERALSLTMLNTYLDSESPRLRSLAHRVFDYLTRVAPPPLRILTLGRFEVRQSRTAIPDNAWQRRAGELFRLLLISPGHTLLRDQAIAQLWPESAPATAGDLFYRATSALRRALEPDLPDKSPSRYIEVGQGSVTLHLPTGSYLDNQEFEACVRASEWRRALDLYRGDLYPGDLYAEWATEPREVYRQQALGAALALARQSAASGDDSATLAAARRALAIEPWQEEATLLGMQALMSGNDRVGALRLYRDLARRLQDELGIQPQVQLQALYRSLL